MSLHEFAVDGMHCASCGLLIDETVEELDGVRSSTTNVRAGVTTVEVDAARCSPDEIVTAINGAGYTARHTTPA
jgi:copper chaperone